MINRPFVATLVMMLVTTFVTSFVTSPVAGISDAAPDQADDSQFDPALSSPKRHLLVWQDQPSHEVLVNWGLDQMAGANDHAVYYSKEPWTPDLLSRQGADERSPILEAEARESGMQEACGSDAYANMQAKLSKLEADTVYYYRVRSGRSWSSQLHFRTAPSSRTAKVQFLAGGDSRSDRGQRLKMNQQIRALVTAEPDFLAFMHGGDFIANGQDCRQWLDWRNDYQATITDDGHILPLIATFGNHEVHGERQFQAQFSSPDGNRVFYFHLALGMIDLVVLNSELSVEGQQRTWLERQLGGLTAAHLEEPRFILASYHRPAWPAVKRPASTLRWAPLFERHLVDLVFESDGHVLKQTCPIRGGACNAKAGVIYVGEGGLGVPQRTAEHASAWYFRQGGYAFPQHHIQAVRVEPRADDLAKTRLIYEVYYNNKFQHRLQLPLRQRSAR